MSLEIEREMSEKFVEGNGNCEFMESNCTYKDVACPLDSDWDNCNCGDDRSVVLTAEKWLEDHPELPTEIESGQGIKFDGDKPRWELLPFEQVEEVVKVLTGGAEKYSSDNWKFVKPRSRYLGAAMRHIKYWVIGEKIDGESGLPHLAHAICCLLFLMWADKYDEEEED